MGTKLYQALMIEQAQVMGSLESSNRSSRESGFTLPGRKISYMWVSSLN